MAKYDERFKLKVVRQYLSGLSGAQSLAQDHGISPSQLKRWVSVYKQHGLEGLRRKGASYDAAFKLQVIHRLQIEHWSLEQTATFFDIRCAAHIGKWERQYHAGGIQALERRRGRSRLMTTKPNHPPEPMENGRESSRERRGKNVEN